MFGFLCSRVVKKPNKGLFCFNGESIKSLYFLQTPFHNRFISNNPTNQKSFTINYLINSCGLSEEKAIYASEKVQLKNSVNPDSVLTLLKKYGFPNNRIAVLIQKHPSYLLSNVDKTLKPKLDFFHSLGLSGPELANTVSWYPYIFTLSLEKSLVPAIRFLKSIVHTDKNLVRLIKRSTGYVLANPHKKMKPQIELLRGHGVSDSNISKLVAAQPQLMTRTSHFNEHVKEIKRMGFDPSKALFVTAIGVLSSLSKSSWEAKVNIFKSWGWSEDEVSSIFRKQPLCMSISGKKIMSVMELLVTKMGYDKHHCLQNPVILMLSYKKRILPRCSVIKVLISNGLVEKDRSLGPMLKMSDKNFLQKYVTNFVEIVPDLLNIYQGKTNVL
ncbi:Mitochondrial transcription termination factor family protein [Thalictrum thalictroides]|uniref:Mitochondrial transcription termination factor family protein n=1 Tax=Thalictrum thalictroides TaxID=46969 RepID=A0A7J6V0P5_THATH|nr:Mitochondrial transcription termination factor family protein [Thalictrum thalictroides]